MEWKLIWAGFVVMVLLPACYMLVGFVEALRPVLNALK